MMRDSNKGRVLELVLKGKWYDLIKNGTKKEEYRERKQYWIKRIEGRQYDTVRFHRGYTSQTVTFQCDGITTGRGKPEWGAPAYDVFIIKLGEQIKTKTNNKQTTI